MTSLKSRILIGLMRNRHLFKGRLKKDVMKQDVESVLQFRAECERGASRFGKLPKDVSVKQESINMILSEWITPDGSPNDKLIFYVHGGGYVSGSCNDHRAIVSKVAKWTGFTNLLYEYGVAPENPYPASINDSVNVYKAILEKGFKSENILIMGESAGGGLALALLLALKEKKLPMPAGAAVIQPWTDLSCTSPSYKTKNKYSLAPMNCWNVFSHYYVAGNSIDDPLISPLFGDLEGLPPIHISAGDHDELFDDCVNFYNKAKEAGVDITAKWGKGMIHCYPLLSPMFPEAKEAMDEIVGFVKRMLGYQ
jgi:monoterpene epsilon-lactone hydrolase